MGVSNEIDSAHADITRSLYLDQDIGDIREQLQKEGYSKIFIFNRSFTIGRGESDVSVISTVVSRGGKIRITCRDQGDSCIFNIINSGTHNLNLLRKNREVLTVESDKNGVIPSIPELMDMDVATVIAQTSSAFELKFRTLGKSIVVGLKDDERVKT